MPINVKLALPIVQEAFPQIGKYELLKDIKTIASQHPELSTLEGLAALDQAMKSQQKQGVQKPPVAPAQPSAPAPGVPPPAVNPMQGGQ